MIEIDLEEHDLDRWRAEVLEVFNELESKGIEISLDMALVRKVALGDPAAALEYLRRNWSPFGNHPNILLKKRKRLAIGRIDLKTRQEQ